MQVGELTERVPALCYVGLVSRRFADDVRHPLSQRANLALPERLYSTDPSSGSGTGSGAGAGTGAGSSSSSSSVMNCAALACFWEPRSPDRPLAHAAAHAYLTCGALSARAAAAVISQTPATLAPTHLLLALFFSLLAARFVATFGR